MPERREQRVLLTKTNRIGIAVIDARFVGPAFSGQGDIDFICPGCSAVLLEAMDEWSVQEIGIKCYNCGTLAYTPQPLR